MAADVGVKLGVSGVSQFKSAMNTAKNSVKQLDAELKLNAAQYKASGDAEEYMAGRSRILSQQIKAQEDVVSQCQKALETMASQGVDKASSSYTQMAAQLAKAKTDLIQMQQAAKGAGEELEEVAESTDKTAAGLDKISSGIKFQNITTALGKVESMLKNMFSHAVNIGKAIANWERGSSDWADTLITDATMYGMDVETLQRWQYAAQLIDTSVEDIIKAQDKLTQKTGSTDGTFADIITGNTQYALRVRDANGALRDQTDVMWDFLDILQKVDNESERNTMAQEYFGKSYRELLPLINAGRKSWEEAAEAAPIVSEEDVSALGKLNDAYVSFDAKVAELSHTLSAQFAPAMEEVLGVLGVVSDKFMAWLQSEEGKAAVKNLGDAIAGLVGGLAEIDWTSVFDGATTAVNKIAEILKGFDSSDILDGLKVVGGIIASWTVGKELMEVYTFFKSMGIGKKLGKLGSGGASAGSSGMSGGLAAGGGFLLAAGTTAAITALVEEERSNPGNGTLSKWRASTKGSMAAKDIIPDTYHLLTGENMVLPDTGTQTGATISRAEMEAAGIKMPTRPAKWLTEDELVDNVLTAFFGKGAGKAPGEELAEGFNEAVAESVKAARMDKNYADILDEEPLVGELTEAGLKTIRDYSNAWMMAQQMHNGRGIDPDMLGAFDMDLMHSIWKNLFPEDFAQQSGFGAAIVEMAGKAGEDASSAFGEGAMSNVEAAFAAGAALAAAFASGAASAAAGAGGNTYNTTTIGDVIVNGAQSPAEFAAAYNDYIQSQQAGYGG